jgi:hypothetical protein
MEPNKKLEKQFKKQMKSREIQPSPAAWDRLDAMLTVAEEKKAGFNYQWLYIAAALIGFLAIAYVFLSNPTPAVDAPRNEVVNQNTPPIQNASDSITQPSVEPQKVDVIEPSFQNKQQSVAQNHHSENRQSKSIQEKSIPQKSTTETQSIAQESSINHQKTESINQTLPLKNAVNPESALAHVEVKIQTSAIKVNASNLLSKVDGELQLSFREKVIKGINKNYQNVKVALANRNQETNINQ